MRYPKKIKILCFSLAVCCVAVACFAYQKASRSVDASAAPAGKVRQIVIDPGHGGMDGGAVGVDGIVEKDINLNISLKLRDILTANGFEVVMTRDKDESIEDKEVEDVISVKKADMRNRLKIMEKNPDSITISVHQNLFEESKYSGAQVFYGPNNPESEVLAGFIQQAFVEHLQKDNTRQIKKAQKDLFLLYYSTTPTVLVECGFLSNPEEARKLTEDEYQSKVAFTIFSGLIQYLSQTGEGNDPAEE